MKVYYYHLRNIVVTLMATISLISILALQIILTPVIHIKKIQKFITDLVNYTLVK